MEHLVGRDVQVVLSLKEGKGFDRIPNPTSIVATLNGQSLETGSIESDSNPRYDTDLVWKADKNLLRKLRCSQEPLKVECFEVKKNDKGEKIGHVLLSLRSAKIVPSGERGERIDILAHWHKLLNLRGDMKACKPELLLTLTIEEHDAYVLRKSREESTENYDGVTNNCLTIATPCLIQEENLIQLGPEASCRNIFLLNVIAINAQNLHLLKDEEHDEAAADNYSLWYRILENDIRLKSFDSLEKKVTLNEKIVIRIRSSYDVLISYLQERPNFLLILQYKDTILGHSEIDPSALIPTETSYDLLAKGGKNEIIINQRCILNKEKTPRTIGDCQDNEAFLDLQLQLVSVGVQTLNHQPCTDCGDVYHSSTRFRHDAFSEIGAHRNSCGDSSKCIARNETILSRTSGLRPTDLPNGSNVRDLHEIVSLQRGMSSATNTRDTPIDAKSTGTHRCYYLNINLTAIKLFSLPSSPSLPVPSSPSIRTIEFRFHHPKTEIISSLRSRLALSPNENCKLQDISYKLHLVSAADEIQRLLMDFPPKISIGDITDNEAITTRIGETILDPRLLFNCDKTLESQYEAPLYDNEKREIGRINVAMYLEDRGIVNRMSGENFGPPIIDDSLAYKVVEELETWKERQQEIFRIELKRKEGRHLDRLSEEWQKRRENLEAKLACSVQQCKMLANSLNKATEDLRNRRLKSLEKEARLIKANEDLQWRLENNIKELQESWRRTQEELTSKVNLLQEEKKTAEAGLETLRVENEKLWLLTSKQAEEIKVCRKGSLTKDQTASLLQDVKTLEQKLANTQKSKSFFKEQWGKAVREIHRMKMENQQAIEVQIKTSKDELKSFDLEKILGADSDALTNDQIMLDHIQKEIEVIEPRSVAHMQPQQTDGLPSRSIFASIDVPLYSQRGPPLSKSQRGGGVGGSAKSEEQDERLRKLIEERDALLKTGSYTIDDTIIVKLNAEIRSLLICN